MPRRPFPRLAPIVAALACVLLVAACAPRLQIVGIDNPDVPVASVEGTKRHKVFIMATRQNTEAVGALFSHLRAEELGFASVEVSIPPTHQVGELEFPRRLPPDPRTDFAIVAPTVYTSDTAYLASLDAALRELPRGRREALFFVHGFNMSTSDAILQVGEFVEDSGFQGVPILFTWASAASLSRYVYDLNSALVARPLMLEAAEIVNRSVASDFHLFAHSMGAFLTMESIVYAAQTRQFNGTGRLRTIVLASPDIDVDLFDTQIADIAFPADRFFVLLSRDDQALRVSRLIAGGVDRLGAAGTERIDALGVTAIDLSEVADSRTGSHSKFAGSPEIVRMIGNGLNTIPEYGSRPRSVLDEVLGDLPIQVVGRGR